MSCGEHPYRYQCYELRDTGQVLNHPNGPHPKYETRGAAEVADNLEVDAELVVVDPPCITIIPQFKQGGDQCLRVFCSIAAFFQKADLSFRRCLTSRYPVAFSREIIELGGSFINGHERVDAEDGIKESRSYSVYLAHYFSRFPDVDTEVDLTCALTGKGHFIRATALLLDIVAILPTIGHMATNAFEVAEMPAAYAVRAIRAGLPARAFVGVADALNLTVDELAGILGVSPRTIRDQRKKLGRLSSENTEKLVRMARIRQQARKVFSTDEAVAGWLRSPAAALEGARPIDLLDTDLGAREVESILSGIAYGNVM